MSDGRAERAPITRPGTSRPTGPGVPPSVLTDSATQKPHVAHGAPWHPPGPPSGTETPPESSPNVLTTDSLREHTTWPKVEGQKTVFKKLKLVHIQVGKAKLGRGRLAPQGTGRGAGRGRRAPSSDGGVAGAPLLGRPRPRPAGRPPALRLTVGGCDQFLESVFEAALQVAVGHHEHALLVPGGEADLLGHAGVQLQREGRGVRGRAAAGPAARPRGPTGRLFPFLFCREQT